MESTEVTNLDLYKALRVIKDTCRNYPNTCEGCPLSIEIPKLGIVDNKVYSYIACRVYNQQYPNVPRPDTWKLNPPPDYTPFSDS